MNVIAHMVGGLVPTLLLSRLLLWITQKWNGGLVRLVAVHVASWLLSTIIAGFGMADGGQWAGGRAAALYALPQLIWFAADVARSRSRKANRQNLAQR